MKINVKVKKGSNEFEAEAILGVNEVLKMADYQLNHMEEAVTKAIRLERRIRHEYEEERKANKR